jgi:anti-sigma B factor antagonist
MSQNVKTHEKALSSMTFASTAISNARTISTDWHPAVPDPATFSAEETGATTLIRLEGAFDALSSPAARHTLDALVKERRSPVTIDMSGLRSIDSSGVGAVVSLYKRVRAQGGRVSIHGLQGQPLAIFQLLRLDRLMAA